MTLTPRLVLFTLAGILVYLGLAILGWGGVGAFLSHPTLTATDLVTVMLTVAATI